MSDFDERDRYEDEDDLRPRRRVIDVSEGDPVVVEQEFPFAGYAPERVRVYVSRSSRASCAIPLVVVLLVLCCGCVGFWVLADNLF